MATILCVGLVLLSCFVLLPYAASTSRVLSSNRAKCSGKGEAVVCNKLNHRSNWAQQFNHATVDYEDIHTTGYTTRPRDDGYYGFTVTMDVYGFSLGPGQLVSYGGVWVTANDNDEHDEQGRFQIGWRVESGDERPVFYLSCQASSASSLISGSPYVDMECPGFQLESGASIQPGDFIPGVSRPNGARQYMALKVFKDSASGDWLVYYGFNSDPELIGRLPKSIFSGLAYRAIALWFSGMAINNATFQPTPALPPVGSGYMAGHGSNMAASMSNLQLIDERGQALSTAKHLIGFSSNPKLYSYTAIVDDQFFYGGPGRTTSSGATSSTTAIYSLLALFISLLL